MAKEKLVYYPRRSSSVRIDQLGTVPVLTYGHDAVHKDIIINANDTTEAGTTEILYLFKTPAVRQIHLEYNVISSGAAIVSFFEDCTVSADGTPVTTSRLFRTSDKVTGAVVTKGPAVLTEGTLLKKQVNGGGGTGSNIRGGSAVHDDAEWVLKLDALYLMKIERTTSGVVGVEFEWYEVPEITVLM